MEIICSSKNNIDPDSDDVEIVERKGIGHPDSVADIIAEHFSNKYSNYCLEKYGVVLNHWFDKVLISGGEANLKPGYSKVIKKPTVYLFGKITKVYDKDFILEELFRDTVITVFTSIFNIPVDEVPKISIDINSGIGTDHAPTFYSYDPKASGRAKLKLTSNDSVFCVGYAPYSKLENFVVNIENYINFKKFKMRFPETGYDVKVLAKRHKDNVDITVCVPFIANKVKSWSTYQEIKSELLHDLYKYSSSSWDSIKIYLNTKDVPGMGYLTVYGTALDKGDFGVVGRGNRYSGFISANRGETQEAYHGKNPIIHSGKLYSIISHRVARRVSHLLNIPVEVIFTINNGARLNDPNYLYLYASEKFGNSDNLISKIANFEIQGLEKLSKKIVSCNPITEFVNKSMLEIKE